jgi:hypothetical protein
MTTPTTNIRYVLTSGTVASPTFAYGSIDLLEALDLSHAEQLVITLNDNILVLTTDFTVNEGTEEITLVGTTASGLAVNDVLVIERSTKIDAPYVDYENNAALDADDLDVVTKQLLFLIQELRNISDDGTITLDDVMLCWDAKNRRICNVADGVADQDAVNLRQLLSAIEGAEVGTVDNVGFFAFTGDGVETDFTLTGAGIGYTSPEEIFTFVGGVVQRPTTSFTVSAGDTPNPIVSFSTAPGVDQSVYCFTIYGLVKAVLQTEIIDGGSLSPDSVELSSINWGSGDAGRILILDASGNETLRIPVHTDISDFDAGVRTNRLDQMAVPTASLSVNSQKITSLQAGTTSTDAVNKSQMDAAIAAASGAIDVGAISVTGSTSTNLASPGSVTVTNSGSKAMAVYADVGSDAGTSGEVVLSIRTSSGAYIEAARCKPSNTGARHCLFGIVPIGGAARISGTPGTDLLRLSTQPFL